MSYKAINQVLKGTDSNIKSYAISNAHVVPIVKTIEVVDEYIYLGQTVRRVFCVTYPTIFAIGDIFLYGYTAALAWDLPQDPYSPFDHRADPLHRRMDNKNIFFTDYDGKILFTKPYKRKPIVNPAFAKRSVSDDPISARGADFERTNSHEHEKQSVDRRQMHAEQIQRPYLQQTDERSADFHRSSRADLYAKIENLFTAVGADGRACTLRLLCESRRMRNSNQGTFVEEIILAVFTWSRGGEEDVRDRCHTDLFAGLLNVLYSRADELKHLDLETSVSDIQMRPEVTYLTLSGRVRFVLLLIQYPVMAQTLHVLPSGTKFLAESEKEYDTAHSATDSCAALYPCDQFTQDPQPKAL
ncbi:hypothetical protein EVAR_91397_1 [Eumeta japonica]|uniref:Uncharacterized protein n=1 Tax=Eumeta variegata TaxID=151549 RepID=A0A4C1XBK4_EUMVA|nr:hypothetical protein EVAR_91397_1 [Eumeta japonica]